MDLTREMFGREAATATSGRAYADPKTGRISGYVAKWGQCLRGAPGCPHLERDTTDLDKWREPLVTLADGEVIAAGGMAYGPAHPNPSRTDPTVMHELMRPEHFAARVVPHATDDGIYIAGVVAPEAVERWGSVEAAAAAFNGAAWSVHAGPSADNPGMVELWGVVAVISAGLPQGAPEFALAAACGGDTPCAACAASTAADAPAPPVDTAALAEQVADVLEQRAAQREAEARIAAVEPLERLR